MNFHRICLILLALTSAVWIWKRIEARQIDREFQEAVATIAPQGGRAGTGKLEAILERRGANWQLESYCFRVLGILAPVWALGTAAFTLRQLHQRAAPDRPADANAGQVLAKVKESRGVFEAHARGLGLSTLRGRAVRVDLAENMAIFHDFRVVRSFVCNYVYERLEVPLSDIVVVRLWPGRQRTLEV